MLNITPDWNRSIGRFKPTWSRMVNVDQFVWMTRVDMLEQLEMAKADLGFEYVRACGMLDDKMKALWDDPADFRLPKKDKKRHLNFQVIDMVLDRLAGLGIRPLYTTTFTPSAMASGTAEIWQHSNITLPKDLKAWTRFVQDGIEHEINHRGLDEVSRWYFECWNEANLKDGFFAGTQEEWFGLWAATYAGVKAANPGLKIGGPSTARGEWMEEFLDWTAEHGCEPDYLISHFYNNDSESEPLSPFDGPASSRVKDSPHFGAGVVRGTRKLLDERGFKGEMHWNEWGRSWFPHDPVKETPVEATYVVKTMAEVSDQADMFAFWCISDIYDQVGYARKAFQGNYGLLNMHGLRKPAYFAHMLLNRTVGDRYAVPAQADVEACEGAVATHDGDTARLLVYRYPESPTDDVTTGPVEALLPAGSTNIRLTPIDRDHHNIVAQWEAIGAPDYLTMDQQRDLKAANHLTAETSGFEVDSGEDGVRVRFQMERPSVVLIEADVS
ncbi:MAG: GH39 family glycosyl hydrolase [Opitutales bacterium]